MNYQISELNRYPVKSMGAVTLQQARIDRFGIEKDRRWMLVDQHNQFLTQRKIARMSLLSITEHQSSEGDWGISIQVNKPSRLSSTENALHFSKDQNFSNETLSVSVWGENCEGRVADDYINLWLSQVLEEPCRLVFMDDGYQRKVDTEYAKHDETVSFTDGFPLLLTTESSLAAFNTHLTSPIEMLRFRPNIVLRGNEAFAEDGWKRIKVGSMEFRVVKPCSRCAIPTINLGTAEKEPEVFKALKKHRSNGRKVYFGQNLLAVGQGVISVGDTVEIIE